MQDRDQENRPVCIYTRNPWTVISQIDQIIGKSLTDSGLTPAAISSDAEFVRRIYLDLNGIIPTALQAATFLDDPSADKRQQLI